jgi:ubiquinone/menaquinone biosynthesis C-methylase UbiE
MIQTLVWIGVILAILATFSRKKFTSKRVKYLPAYTSSHVEDYDTITYDSIRIHAELACLSTPQKVLDVGSGTGHHVHALHQKGVQAIGIDKSPEMVLYSKKKYPHLYIQGDVLNMSIFPSESFSHITCFYYTLYYLKNKKTFFQNAYHWLTPGGFLILHVSKKWDYGSALTGTLQYTSTHTNRVHRECITKKGVTKCYEHIIYMESEERIVEMAKQTGFIVHAVYPYVLPYKYQNIYVFRRV